jgi:Magnesium-protoporphyrin IX methyltransferase C-terminus
LHRCLRQISLQRVVELLARLSHVAKSRLILTFTPKTPFDGLLLKLGNRYAQRHNLPAIYTHRAEVIRKAAAALGWKVERQASVASRFNFYYCNLWELARDRGCVDGRAQRKERRFGAPAHAASTWQEAGSPETAERCPHAARVLAFPAVHEGSGGPCATSGGDRNAEAQSGSETRSAQRHLTPAWHR